VGAWRGGKRGGSSSWRISELPAEWPSIRRAILIRDRGMCLYGLLPDEDYELGSCNTTATDVDHIGKPWEHDDAHLRSLCGAHHRSRTSRQANAARRAKLIANGGHFRAERPHPGRKPQ
jgi:5-methylcytosine-specific restriction endonuclease McrA